MDSYFRLTILCCNSEIKYIFNLSPTTLFQLKLYNSFVGADPCVRPGNVNRVNHTIRFNRDKRTCNSAHKIIIIKQMLCSCPAGVRSRTATLLSLRDISPDRGISHGSAPTVLRIGW